MPWSVFVFLVFFVAARREKVRGERLEAGGKRLEAASLSSKPSRHFAPFAVKMYSFVFVFLVFFVAARRQKVRGERLEVIGPILSRAGAAGKF